MSARAIAGVALATMMAACLAALDSPRSATADAPTIRLPERGRAPDFTVVSLAGQKLDLAEIRSHGPVVLDFWATWCKPCLMALPELEKLHARYRDRGLTVIGISVDGPRNAAKVRPFAGKLRVRFPVAIDRDENIQQLYQVKACPTTFLIAPDGRIVWYRQGYLPGDGDALGEAIASLLDSTATPTAP
jgi:cytochrome c biogenesis protein CcmG/thiol:disulfide interchange protein DsbE